MLQINSNHPDLHSGMQGGDVSEPLLDMVRLLASLTDTEGVVKIPNFLDDVRVLGKQESDQFDTVVHRSNAYVFEPRF